MKKLPRILLIVFVVSALALTLLACNETLSTEHVHQWSEWSVDTATCTQGGTQTRTCTREGCNAQDGKPATETRITNALGHDKYKVNEAAATCTTNTIEHWACHRCDDWTDDKEIDGTALDHDKYKVNETAATCTTNVIEHWACHRCNDWTDDKEIDGTALDHDKYKVNETAATCTTNKVEHWACHRCNDWTDDREIDGTALDHNYGNWITEVSATCEAIGTKGHYHCGVCGTDFDSEKAVLQDLTLAINPDNHTHLSAVEERDATCVDAGWNAHYVCDGCSKKYETADAGEEYDPTIAALGHNVTSWTPCETDDGKHEGVCSRTGCSVTVTEACNDDGVLTGSAATCEAAGREDGTKCSLCGGNQVEGEVINALGHAWGDWDEDTATCTAGGTQTRTCTRNGCNTNDGQPAVETHTTNALGHNLSLASFTPATCTAAQINHMACSRCGYTEDQTVGEALGHNYTDVAWTAVAGGTHERECARGCGDKQTGTCDSDGVLVGTAATCEEAGHEDGTKCSVCGGNQVEGEVITALGHSLSVVSTTDATCTASKIIHMACSRCDHTEDQTEGEALGHDYTGAVSVVVPDDTNYHAVACVRCDVLDLDNKHAAEWGEYRLTENQTQHYQVCTHCNVQSTPTDHSATTYTYTSNGEHSGECACGQAVTEKCELAEGSNACSACGRIVGSINDVGGFTIDFSTYGNANIDPMPDIIIDGVTINFVKGSAGYAPRYWANDHGMRTYKGNSLTFTAPKGGKITSISFTGSFSSDSAGYNSSSKTWTGSNETVTLNITDRSDFTKIAIAFESVEQCYHDDTVVACQQSAATCEGTGIAQDCYHCENCGLYFTTDACKEILENAVIDALGHTYGDWIDEVASTCAATGTKGHFHCDACGTDFDSEENEYAVLGDLTIAINPNNHSQLSAVAGQAATCGDDGWNAHYECDGCGKKYETEDAGEEYDPAVAALGHNLQYRANGTDKHEQYCTRCDYVEEAEAHTATTWVAETNGHHQVCTVCGLDFNEDEHSYNTDGVCVCGMEDTHEHNYTGTVTKQPTCTEKGVTTYACDGCDTTYTQDIDALGHDFTGDVLPTTDDANYHATQCARCDAFDVDNKAACAYTEENVDADGHHTACVCGRIGSSTPHEYAAATQTCSCGNINPTYLTIAGSDNVAATFEMGTGSGNATGSNTDNYSETANGYTLAITKESGSMFINAGNGTDNVLRLATSGVAASLSFTVPDNVIKVVIYVARYNSSKAVQLTINGVDVDSPTGSAYIPVTVDTRSVKTILLGADKYCFIDKIEYWVAGQDYFADLDQTPSVTAADCTNAGKVSFYCTTAGCTILHEVAIPALGHTYGEWIAEIAATCVETGTKGHYHCDVCGNDLDSEQNEYAVLDDLTIAIDPNNHADDLTYVGAQAPTTCDVTDTEHAGHVEYWQCACGVTYADENRNTVIDSLQFTYLDHTPNWTTLTDTTHAGSCRECGVTLDAEPHDWNDENTACTICGQVKSGDLFFVTVVVIVDGTPVEGIPAGVTLTWAPELDGNAFVGEEAFVEIILPSNYKFAEGDAITVINAGGADATDLMVDGNTAMFTADDDYTLTITLVSIPTAVVNYSVDNATVTVTDSNGTTINSGDRVPVGTELTITVTASEGYEVKSVTVNGTVIENGKYTVAETDTITIAATVEENKDKEILITGAQMLTAGNITSNSYTQYIMAGTKLGCGDYIKSITINASKQTSQLSDMPVTKTKAITIEASEGKSITYLGLQFSQWSSNALGTISIKITYGDGETATITGDGEFTQTFDLSEYSNVTKIEVTSSGNTSKQAGIEQIDLKVK